MKNTTPTTHYQNIIIGFGKGGKTLAAALAKAGQPTALVEQSPAMYGGTCINVACIPTKSLEHSARQSAAQGGDAAAKAHRYQAAVAEKRRLTAALRQKNYDKLAAAGVDILDGTARFLDPHRLAVTGPGGTQTELTAERFFLNTGAAPVLPSLPGLAESPRVYTSATLMEQDALPRRLVIIGGGYIGLEFASYYANFGAQVTVLQHGESFLPKEDAELAAAVLADFEARGVQILRGAEPQRVEDCPAEATVHLLHRGQPLALPADAVLVATGRRPNVEALNLPAAGVALTGRGAVQVNDRLQTTAPHIWAMGDVTGGLQFTYISLDDSRIVRDQLLGGGTRTTQNRGAVPYTVFLDPPLARVGLTEAEARRQYPNVKIARLPAAAIPKAQVLRRPRGLLKAVVDGDTGLVLGAHLYCAESQEIINLIKLAIDAKLPYTALRDAIYTHPTMAEALNDLFAALT